ncbi:MAG: hypothetical protein IJT20_03760 [Synergistaceae bacterium]|nr:hypothetical protein [Synergistaceae bacterium]
MKKIFLSFIFLGLLCGVSSADVVYTATAGASAGIGLIKISSSSDITTSGLQYSNAGAGSIVAPYWENNTSNGNGTSKLILITPVDSTDTTISGDQAYIFSPSNLNTPENSAPIILTGTYGTPIISGTSPGAYLYLASNSAIREYATANFTLRNIYTVASSDSLPNPEVKGLMVDSRVHALIQRPTGSGDVIMHFDGQLKASSSTATNTTTGSQAMCSVSSGTAVAHNKGVQILSGSTSSDAVVTSDPVIAICRDTSSGFYYIEKGSSNFSLKHYKDKDNTTTIFNDVSVDTNRVQLMQADNNLLAVVIAGEIRFYNMANNSDAHVKTFSLSSLGGSAVSIAAATTSGNNGSSGGSGCQLGLRSEELGGLMLLALALFAVNKKKVIKL